MFMLVCRRYERASLIVTSNKPFSAWGEIFGDDAVAVAMIDRLVHHAEILSLKGDSYRLKDRDLGPRPARTTPTPTDPTQDSRRRQPAPPRLRLRSTRAADRRGVNSQPAPQGQFSAGLDTTATRRAGAIKSERGIGSPA